MQTVLVTGGTGALGRYVVEQLRDLGYGVRVMSRRSAPAHLSEGLAWTQANLMSGKGLADAVQGVDIIVHAASSPFRRPQLVDVDGTARLLKEACAAGVGHIVYISIVGIEHFPTYYYYKAKLKVERQIEQSGLLWSILRATQFHSLIDRMLQVAVRFPLIMLPLDVQLQLIAESEVAARLCELVQAGPSGRVADMGGPRVQLAGELARSWLELRGVKRPLISLWLPGKTMRSFRRGDTTCPDQAVGKITWAEWLQAKYGLWDDRYKEWLLPDVI